MFDKYFNVFDESEQRKIIFCKIHVVYRMNCFSYWNDILKIKI